jgi:hypothetical protein
MKKNAEIVILLEDFKNSNMEFIECLDIFVHKLLIE